MCKMFPRVNLSKVCKHFHLISFQYLILRFVRPCHHDNSNNQGVEHLSYLEQQIITTQRTLDLIKDDMYNHLSLSLLSYTQQFVLKCGVSKYGMTKILFSTIPGYEFNFVPCFEEAHVLPCISTTLLMSSSEKKRTHSLWEQ